MEVQLEDYLYSLPVISIILVNTLPLFGVIFFGWTQAQLLLAYWSESAVIGFYTLIKLFIGVMTYKEPENQQKGIAIPVLEQLRRLVSFLFVAGFFIVHFGAFMFVHLLFINSPLFFQGIDIDLKLFSQILPITIGFLISHGVSFMGNFIVRKEYKTADYTLVMFSPYLRIFLMQIAIIFGAFLMIFGIILKIPILGPALILIVGKLALDVSGHILERINLEYKSKKHTPIRLTYRNKLVRTV